jgi:hypothetical protein
LLNECITTTLFRSNRQGPRVRVDADLHAAVRKKVT